MKPFKSKGWVHLEKMTELMPGTVKGAHVFCPSQGVSSRDTFFEETQDEDALEEPEDPLEGHDHSDNTPVSPCQLI
jgi:hypothetical protein